MKLIVGLGNPGSQYERNRHNVGFMAVDAIAAAVKAGSFRKRFNSEIVAVDIGGEPCQLLKPLTFMNESGQAVGAAMRFFKLTPADVIVIHDELDLAAGKIRVKTGGGNAGNNGLRSITAHIGNDYVRLRIGVGHPGVRELVQHHLLNDFAKADRIWLEPLLQAIADAVEWLVKGDFARFQNAVARALPSEQKPAAAVTAKTTAPRQAERAEKPSEGSGAAVRAEPPAAVNPFVDKLGLFGGGRKQS